MHSQIDLALNVWGSEIYIYLNSGSGIDLSTHSAQVPGNGKGHHATRAFYAAADVDMDGHLDLIVPMIETCFGDGSGTTFACSDVPPFAYSDDQITGLSVGDFDGAYHSFQTRLTTRVVGLPTAAY